MSVQALVTVVTEGLVLFLSFTPSFHRDSHALPFLLFQVHFTASPVPFSLLRSVAIFLFHLLLSYLPTQGGTPLFYRKTLPPPKKE